MSDFTFDPAAADAIDAAVNTASLDVSGPALEVPEVQADADVPDVVPAGDDTTLATIHPPEQPEIEPHMENEPVTIETGGKSLEPPEGWTPRGPEG